MKRTITAVTVAALAGSALALTPQAPAPTGASLLDPEVAGLADFPEPIDPESWELPEWMTWDDYVAIPGVDWNDPDRQPAKKIRAALVLGDFQDREFVVTQPEGSDLFGLDGVHNPIGVGEVPRDEVADFYKSFLITEPQPLNNGHTVNEYWLEDSYGLIGVDADAFGPYRMAGNEHEYGLGGGDAGGAGGACPAGDSCGRSFDDEILTASLADVTTGIATNGGRDYDFRWFLHAGYDESGVWEEFGRMLWADREDVPDAFGNPDPNQANWAGTRYVDWTSFAAAKGIWSHALPGAYSTQGENDGQSTFAHELSHIFGVLDNYNNPFGDPVRRSYSGLWDMLSRGTFNGPGGTHNRWQIPPTLGGSMGSHHMLRNKLRLGFMQPDEVLFLQDDVLQRTGIVAVDIYPRAYPLAPITTDVGLHGVQIVLDRDRGVCATPGSYDCDGGGYHNYTIEFVDRIGYDSFATDSGVLIAKTKDADLAPFIWVVDAHPEDINTRTGVGEHEGREVYDYIQPDGGVFPISLGDARQLADAAFHAGAGEGVVNEYVDAGNRLHFYVLGTRVDERGVRTYRVAVRHLDAAAPLGTAVTLDGVVGGEAAAGRVAEASATLTGAATSHDIYRITAASADGFDVRLTNTFVESDLGDTGTHQVPLYVGIPEDAAAGTYTVTLTATSELDPSVTSSVDVTVTVQPAPAA